MYIFDENENLPIKIIWFVAIQIVPHFSFDINSFDFLSVVNQVEQGD